MIILIFCLLYITIFGVVILKDKHPKISNSFKEQHQVQRFYGNEPSQDRVILLEEKTFAGLARVNLMENAQESIDLAYYAIHKGYITDLILGMILDAADRGVKVRILLDGIFHGLRFSLKDTQYALINHPNVEIKYYEPFHPHLPWTWHNRLHDKLFIIDHKYAVIGGRNIGNRYFVEEGEKNPTNDRDVLILNTEPESKEGSVLNQMEGYFNEVWNHPYTKHPLERLSERQQKKAKEANQQLKEKLENLRKSDKTLFNNYYDWLKMSLPTKKVTFIHNPIQRFNKEPWAWYDLTNLMKNAKRSLVIQSPYVIPTKPMLPYMDKLQVAPENTTVLTNSLASTANVIAYSGHIKHINGMVNKGVNVLEYQGPDSIHAKTFIFDDRLSAIGAFNMDARSAFLNTESMVVIDSEEFTEALKKEMDHYFNKSLKVAKNKEYVEDPHLKPGKVSWFRSFSVKGLSYITGLFQHLL
ncbi:phospholipase D-like domain-containing protein [Neobacillus sp. D3-1R]|uniref:phospholipase D-like domain-containing protein n=1 Tax=Neobacillus sp. D3-1R TaxID=3445778 RepID=UPI003FA15CE4